ncbi:MAG: hypothetical protein WD649_04890 [Thermoleophilaceae bacterium]
MQHATTSSQAFDTVGISVSTSFNSTADPYAVMRRMGHSSITVTYGTYGHLFPRRDEDITAGLEALRATVERRSA